VPKTVEFPSLAGFLKGTGTGGQDAVFCYYRDFQRCVRTKDHKLIVYPQVQMTQVFDLNKDPWETRNLASDPQYASVKRDLLHRLRQFQTELGDKLDLKIQFD
jgi:choline-sulfatase